MPIFVFFYDDTFDNIRAVRCPLHKLFPSVAMLMAKVLVTKSHIPSIPSLITCKVILVRQRAQEHLVMSPIHIFFFCFNLLVVILGSMGCYCLLFVCYGELMLKCCSFKMHSYNKPCFLLTVVFSYNDVWRYMSSDVDYYIVKFDHNASSYEVFCSINIFCQHQCYLPLSSQHSIFQCFAKL